MRAESEVLKVTTLAEAVDEFEFFLDKRWSDGLPVVTPTEERVARMLAATTRDPSETVGMIPPAMEAATVRTVAIHALMAVTRPRSFLNKVTVPMS